MMKKLARQQYSYTNLSPQVADQLRELAVGIQQGLVTAATAMISSARLAKKAREILIESKKEEEFGDWVEQELGIDQRRIGTLINSLSYVDEFSGSDGSWDIGALELGGTKRAMALSGVSDEIKKRLDRGDRVTKWVAKQCIAEARKNIEWPDGVTDEARDMISANISVPVDDQDLLEQLALYDDETQEWLVESVIEGKQNLEQAVVTGEVPFSSVEDTIESENKSIENLCRGLHKMLSPDSRPQSKLLDDDTWESARSHVKSIQSTLRLARGKACPKCSGLVDDCASCNGLGRVSELVWSQIESK